MRLEDGSRSPPLGPLGRVHARRCRSPIMRSALNLARRSVRASSSQTLSGGGPMRFCTMRFAAVACVCSLLFAVAGVGHAQEKEKEKPRADEKEKAKPPEKAPEKKD